MGNYIVEEFCSLIVNDLFYKLYYFNQKLAGKGDIEIEEIIIKKTDYGFKINEIEIYIAGEIEKGDSITINVNNSFQVNKSYMLYKPFLEIKSLNELFDYYDYLNWILPLAIPKFDFKPEYKFYRKLVNKITAFDLILIKKFFEVESIREYIFDEIAKYLLFNKISYNSLIRNHKEIAEELRKEFPYKTCGEKFNEEKFIKVILDKIKNNED